MAAGFHDRTQAHHHGVQVGDVLERVIRKDKIDWCGPPHVGFDEALFRTDEPQGFAREGGESRIGLSSCDAPSALGKQLEHSAITEAHVEHATTRNGVGDGVRDLVVVIPARELHILRFLGPGGRRCGRVVLARRIELVQRFGRWPRVLVDESARSTSFPLALGLRAVEAPVVGDVIVVIRDAQREALVGFATQRTRDQCQAHRSTSNAENVRG